MYLYMYLYVCIYMYINQIAYMCGAAPLNLRPAKNCSGELELGLLCLLALSKFSWQMKWKEFYWKEFQYVAVP